MGNNTQSRKWSIVQNNPQDCGLTHEAVAEILNLFSPAYFCMADEIADSGTYHTHVFMYCPSPVRFSTIKNRFPAAHIEKSYGSVQQNRDYTTKTGKWADTGKAETAVEGSFMEWGEIPAENAEKAPEMYKLIQNVRDGISTSEIVSDSPKLAFRVKDIDTLRQTMLAERYTSEMRQLDVSYVYGTSGTGKTRGIFAKHSPKDIYRLTNYRTGRGVSFDGYHGQGVLVFEEFSGQIPLEEMLNYLDIYPLYLPARYNDRVACYTTVYITSNSPLSALYTYDQLHRPETWGAFYRRIHRVIKYNADGTTTVIDTKTYTNTNGGIFNG